MLLSNTDLGLNDSDCTDLPLVLSKLEEPIVSIVDAVEGGKYASGLEMSLAEAFCGEQTNDLEKLCLSKRDRLVV